VGLDIAELKGYGYFAPYPFHDLGVLKRETMKKRIELTGLKL
jgi:hypothetical protein